MIIDHIGVVHVDSGLPDDRTSNMPSNFTNFMHTSFQYSSDDFEVGLHEIQIPCCWETVRPGQCCMAFDGNVVASDLKTVNAGCYFSIGELLHAVNSCFGSSTTQPRLIYDHAANRVISVMGEVGQFKHAHIYMTKMLAEIFGFTKYFLTVDTSNDPVIRRKSVKISLDSEGQERIVAARPFSLTIALPRLFINCSLVKHVGPSTRHLLRAIPVDKGSRFGDILVKVFDRPIFLPLSCRYFDRISVSVTDSEGNEVKFCSGSVIATLEIRRKQDAIFGIL